MAGEKDAEHVVDFTLIPQGTVVQASNTRHGAGLIGVGLNADTGVVSDAKQIVHNLETLLAGWVIDGSNVGDLSKFRRGMVFQEGHEGNNTGRRNIDGEFVFPHGELLDEFGKAGHHILPILVQAISLFLKLVRGVDDRCAERALS